MGKINRNPVGRKVERKLKNKLWKALSFYNSPRQAQEFWEKFLTPSEILILAKRLELFRMSVEKRSYSKIKDELKVGSITISRTRNTLRRYGSRFKEQILEITS